METFSFAIGFACPVIVGIVFVAVKTMIMARNNKRLIDKMSQRIYDLNKGIFKEIGATYRYVDSKIDKMINKGKDKKQILND